MEVDKKLRAAVSYQKAEDFDRARNIYLDILLNVENADALNNLAILTLNSSDGANVHSLFYRCLQVSENEQHFINYTSIQNKLGEVTSQFMKLLDSLPQTKKILYVNALLSTLRQATTRSVSTLTSVEHYLNLFNSNRLDYDTIPPVSYDLVVFLSNRFNMEVSYRLDEISDNISVLCQVLRNKLLDPEILKKIIGTIKLPPADILITLQCLSFKNKIGIENGKVLIQVSSIDEKTLRFLIEKRLPYEIQKTLRHKLYFLNRKSFEAFGGLIQFLYVNRNYREALKYIHDAPHAFTQISQVKILQASCYRHCGLYEQGENLLLPLVNVDESAVTNLINIYTDNNKVKLARRLFEKNSKRIESPVFWYNGVSIANDPKEAVTFLEKVPKNDKLADVVIDQKIFYDYLAEKVSRQSAIKQLGSRVSPTATSAKWLIERGHGQVFFDRWKLFDYCMTLCRTREVFLEFGVWRGHSFRYIAQNFAQSYGFDTFTGLPEEWIGHQKGAYTADGKIPVVDRAKFYDGLFSETVPHFRKEVGEQTVSLLNLDADLYQSTVDALFGIDDLIDHDTIIIFDELINNPNWELDEYRALNEFCEAFNCEFRVIASSLITRQVAVQLDFHQN